MNIGLLLERQARYRPNHVAIIVDEHRLTYAQFNRRVNRLANGLQALGVGKGDKIATFMGNGLEMLEIYWAGAKIGAVVVPLSPLLRGHGLINLLTQSDTMLLFTSPDFVEIVDGVKADVPDVNHYLLINDETVGDGGMDGYTSYADLMDASAESRPITPAISGDDPYNIIYSSGTTGLPKGIVLSHFARSMYAMQYAAAYRFTPESIALHTGSLVFNGAFLTMMPSFYLGSTYILHRQFNAEEFIATVAREKVTHVKMVPSQIVAVLHSLDFSPEKLASLEMIGSVGAPLHMEHKEALNAALPGRFYELYGLTEGFMTILDKEDYAAKPTSVGVPLPFFEMGIMDENGRLLPANEIGEIVGKSPQIMSGYYKRPDLTKKTIRDGWLHSGDVGYVDEDGFLYLVDRHKDMIISGGVNVYPRDIEEVIVQHEAVQETAVFGIPSTKWGETPLAAVILKSGATINEDTLAEWVNARVGARYQRIHAVVFHANFPRSAAGKTLKRLLRDPYWADKDVNL